MQNSKLEEGNEFNAILIVSNLKSKRAYAVTTALLLAIFTVLILFASNSQPSPIEGIGMILSPDTQLEQLVRTFAEHANTMSLAEMKKRLADWRNSPATILDLGGEKRVQAFSLISLNKT